MNPSSFSKKNREQQVSSAGSASQNNKKTIVLKKRSKEKSNRSQVLRMGKTMMMMIRIKIKIKTKRNTHRSWSIKKMGKMPSKELKMSYRELVINQTMVEVIHSKYQMLMATSLELARHNLAHSLNKKTSMPVNQILRMSLKLVSTIVFTKSLLTFITKMTPIRIRLLKVRQVHLIP